MYSSDKDETWVCDKCKKEILFDDELPAGIPIEGDLCQDCAAATKAKCMDCGKEYPVTELEPEYERQFPNEERLLCEACSDARWEACLDKRREEGNSPEW